MKLKKITPRQQDVLILLYRYRFLNRLQLQALLGHNDHKQLNVWLKDLRQKQYVDWIYSTGYAERTKPGIYFLGANGVRYLRMRDDCAPELVSRLNREKTRSVTFRERSLLFAEFALTLRDRSTGGVSYEFATQSDFARVESVYRVLADTDWQFLFIKDAGDVKTRFLLEIFDAMLPASRVKARLKRCIPFYYSNDWETRTDTSFPVLLFICATLTQLISCKRYMRHLLKEANHPENLHIRFATIDEVVQLGVTGEVWEEA